MARSTESHSTPFDVIGARLTQATAALNMIQETHDAEHGFSLSDKVLYEALWAIDELLHQAQDAFDDEVQAHLVEHERHMGTVQ